MKSRKRRFIYSVIPHWEGQSDPETLNHHTASPPLPCPSSVPQPASYAEVQGMVLHNQTSSSRDCSPYGTIIVSAPVLLPRESDKCSNFSPKTNTLFCLPGLFNLFFFWCNISGRVEFLGACFFNCLIAKIEDTRIF